MNCKGEKGIESLHKELEFVLLIARAKGTPNHSSHISPWYQQLVPRGPSSSIIMGQPVLRPPSRPYIQITTKYVQ